MANIGGPRPAPEDWGEPLPSWIEKEFSKSLGEDLLNKCEIERWFGDNEKTHRYRVDFLFPRAKIIVELDGYEYHHTKEQLTNDALRQRYLVRSGYKVIRFTGREIYKDVERCVRETRVIHEEALQREPAKYRAFFVDVAFVLTEIDKAMTMQRGFGVEVETQPTLAAVLARCLDALHEKSFTTCYLFGNAATLDTVRELDGEVQDYDSGEMRFSLCEDELYVGELGDQLAAYHHVFDNFHLAGDDPAYSLPFADTNAEKNCKILRMGDHESHMISEDLRMRWQDIYYPICLTMGVAP